MTRSDSLPGLVVHADFRAICDFRFVGDVREKISDFSQLYIFWDFGPKSVCICIFLKVEIFSNICLFYCNVFSICYSNYTNVISVRKFTIYLHST